MVRGDEDSNMVMLQHAVLLSKQATLLCLTPLHSLEGYHTVQKGKQRCHYHSLSLSLPLLCITLR